MISVNHEIKEILKNLIDSSTIMNSMTFLVRQNSKYSNLTIFNEAQEYYVDNYNADSDSNSPI